MLTLLAPQPESLWDESLPVEVKELPEDLAELDRLLCDPDHGNSRLMSPRAAMQRAAGSVRVPSGT